MLLYIKLLWKMQSTALGMKGVTVGDEKIVPDAWICSALAEKKYMDIGERALGPKNVSITLERQQISAIGGLRVSGAKGEGP